MIHDDKLHEECGVFGIYSRTEDVTTNTYWGLYALQHRGQESAGIAVTDGSWMDVSRGMGWVNEVFSNQMPNMYNKYISIGHVRYSTAGSGNFANAQPLMVRYSGGHISMAVNGALTNAMHLRRDLEEQGSIFQTSIDSEVIVNLIARCRKATLEERICDSLNQIEGAYSIVMMTETQLFGMRDPYAFRPLCLGQTDEGGWVIASESCAFDTIGAKFVRDIEPGEMVVIDDNGMRSIRFSEPKQRNLCVFEHVYFARTDSVIDGLSVHQARFDMGRQLAIESGLKADIVISVPDSGTTAAVGFSVESGIPFVEGLTKNRYIGRTFIQPTQKQRELAVRIKLNAIEAAVKGKSVVMVDDSIVRGTTSARLVTMLREAGAKEVHMCVSSPMIPYPCYYGVDTSVRKDLIAATKTQEEIREIIGADSLHFLSLDGLKKAVKDTGIPTMCYACFDGKYPVPIPDQTDKLD